MRRPLAICCRISALGLRRPRSIWLRYGLDTPASFESWRNEIFALLRCCLMYSPMSRPRSATLSIGFSFTVATSSRLRRYARVLAVASALLALVAHVACRTAVDLHAPYRRPHERGHREPTPGYP